MIQPTVVWGNFGQKRGNFGHLKTLTKVRNLIFFLQFLMNFANQNVLYYILIKKSNKTFPFSYWKGGQSYPACSKLPQKTVTSSTCRTELQNMESTFSPSNLKTTLFTLLVMFLVRTWDPRA